MHENPIVTEKLLSPNQAAEILGIQPRTLDFWRQRGGVGPKFIRYSARCVRYRLSDLQAWIASREVNSEAAA
jgi:predicted DNA-binding transcriptional regulator AlpA